MKLLVVEDDPLIRQSLREMVQAWGFACDEAGDGLVAWDMLGLCSYDLLLLDLNLPGLDGLSLCRRIRGRGGPQPLILMLTARDTNADRVNGLDLGADDYLVKPFDPDVLRAQVKALLRRAARPLTTALCWGGLVLERDGRDARFAGRDLNLTAIEHRLLEALLLAAGCLELGGRAWQRKPAHPCQEPARQAHSQRCARRSGGDRLRRGLPAGERPCSLICCAPVAR